MPSIASYPKPPSFDDLAHPGRPYWMVVEHRVQAWACEVLQHLAMLERTGALMYNDPQVRGYLTAILDGTCARVSKTKWLFCLEGLDEMCQVPSQDEGGPSAGV
ncbi:MAG: hypothetical protein DI587_37250 [Variovorax paradoxus]|nr:MAG: hypothetical protein DI583_37250 [Variovorax paradoxus]PZQ00165.1 MAG: hypothetical protein DI587_37250 [Variovorax paradoxus]